MTTPDKPGFLKRRYYDGDVVEEEGVKIDTKLFTCETAKGLVAGSVTSVVLAFAEPASIVWSIYEDFNLWSNDSEHFYSKSFGDCEPGETVYLEERAQSQGGATEREWYEVIRVLPGHLFVLEQPSVADGCPSPGLPGLGGTSPGFHVFGVMEHGGESLLFATMEHASYAAFDHNMTDEDALTPWRELLPGWSEKWMEGFIPVLRKLISESDRVAS
jgi:hypothetical protein